MMRIDEYCKVFFWQRLVLVMVEEPKSDGSQKVFNEGREPGDLAEGVSHGTMRYFGEATF